MLSRVAVVAAFVLVAAGVFLVALVVLTAGCGC